MVFPQDPLTVIAIGLLSVIFLYVFLFHRSKSTKNREPPMVEGAWPLIGHLPLLNRSKATHHLLGSMADKYGPIFTIKLGTVKALVISDSKTAKECFTTNDLAVSYRPHIVACEHMTYNLAMIGFAPYGDFWRQGLKVLSTGFLSEHRIGLLSHVRVSEVQTSIKEHFDSWSNRKGKSDFLQVEMRQWFQEIGFNLSLRMIVGKRYFGKTAVVGKDEAQKCLVALREYMRLMGTFTVADAVPFLRWFDFGGHEKAMKKNFKELDSVVSGWLEEHQKKRDLNKGKGKGDEDLVDILISMLDGKTIHGFDANTIIKATALGTIIGGTDTTSATLIWTLSLLLNNPHTLEKVKEEIDTHIGKERFVNESDIRKLVYLQAAVKESLRLYPPSPLSGPREFREDCKFGEYHVKKGTRLLTNLWKIQTDPSNWPDPLEFKPERFLTTHKNIDVRGRHYEFIPFGSGRRVCTGLHLGLRTAHLTLANFLHSFEVTRTSSELIDMTSAVEITNIKVTPLEALIKPRLPLKHYEI